MVGGGGLQPGAKPAIKALEETCGIAGVAGRVEGLIEIAKGGGVLLQVHLHAAYVYGGHAFGLKCLHRLDRLGFSRIKRSNPFRCDSPGPGRSLVCRGVDAAALDKPDRGQ